MLPASAPLPTAGANLDEFSPPKSWFYYPAVSRLWGYLISPSPAILILLPLWRDSTDRYNIPLRCSQRIRTEYGRKRFAYRASVLFNALPTDVRGHQGSKNTFGRALKRHMLSAD